MKQHLDALHQLARLHGIDASYVDVADKTRFASTETLRAVLKALGVNARNAKEVQASLKAEKRYRASSPLSSVTAVWGRKARELAIRVPEWMPFETLQGQIQMEGGAVQPIPIKDVRSRSQLVLRLPGLPYGYHRLQLRVGKSVWQSFLICAPTTAFAEKESARHWGVFAPVYALRSKQNWGTGDYADLRTLSSWVAENGGNIIATLPIMAAFLSEPFDPSPYAPASRLFWNEFYLCVPEIPEFPACAEAQRLVRSTQFRERIDGSRRSQCADYRKEMASKRMVLEILSNSFFSRNSSRRSEFETFLKLRPEVREYARFRAVTDERETGWTNWPKTLQQGPLNECLPSIERYHMFVQWCAQCQVDQLIASCGKGGMTLHLDLPLGVHRASFDAWREREIFVTGASGGAPPDAFFTKGQNWGFAPMHPQKMREQEYRYYLEFLRFQMRHTGFLRLDHVMGLHRLYWIPNGFPATEGAYVRYPVDELYAILCLESHRHKTVLVGENLGTVPAEVNSAMARHGIKQMYVVQYSQRPDSRKALRPPPKQSIASLNTHDMPPWAAHWKGIDIFDRADLGLISKKELPREPAARRRANRALAQFLKRNGLLKASKREDAKQVMKAVLEFLAGSEAEYLLINLEDLWAETENQNTPGTSNERPNWKRKMSVSIEEVVASKEYRILLRTIDRLRRGHPERYLRSPKRLFNVPKDASSAREENISSGE